jgi:hypothetical protein
LGPACRRLLESCFLAYASYCGESLWDIYEIFDVFAVFICPKTSILSKAKKLLGNSQKTKKSLSCLKARLGP